VVGLIGRNGAGDRGRFSVVGIENRGRKDGIFPL
jgi:hypothetical protein